MPPNRSTSPRWSIRGLLIVLVAAMVVPLVSLSAFFGYRAYRTNVELREESMQASAKAALTGVQRYLLDAEHMLEGLADDPRIRSLSPKRCAAALRDLRGLLDPTYLNLATWTADAKPVCSLLPTPDTLRIVDAPGFEKALHADSFYVTPVQVGRRSGRWSAHFTYPVRDAAGRRIGMISAAVDLESFEHILRSLDVRSHVIVTLLQPDGTIVARTLNGDSLVGTKIPNTRFAAVAKGLLPATGVLVAPSIEGESYTFAYALIPDADWVVTAGRPTEELNASVRELRVWLLLGLLVVMGSTVAVALAYRRITRPLEKLLDQVSAARPGEPSGIGTDGPREIAWVADRFNRAWNAWAESERARERSHGHLRSLVENAVIGIFVSAEDGRFVEVNQAMVDLLGYASREELLATPLDTLYGGHDVRQRYLDEYGWRSSFRGVGVEWRKKDGEMVQLRLSGRRMVLDDGRMGWEITVDDVTELARLQAQYLQAQKMEALGRFAGGIAHDFNNILTVVQGEAEMLQEDPTLRDDQHRQIEQIHQAAARGGALSHQLLAFGRPSAIEKRPTDLNQVVRNIGIMLRRAAGDSVRVHLELADDLDPVWVNPGQIEQVVMNLCVNARDAMPNGGELVVATAETDPSANPAWEYSDLEPGRSVVLSVSDSGEGIPPEVLPHVFEPFYTTKPADRGTGLGLSTVYGIVTDAGGQITVETEPGKGTTMRVFLPVYEGAAGAATSAPAPRREHTGTGVVLVAEDESSVRDFALRALQRAGYEVIAAPDGAEALRIAMEHPGPIDVLLSDVVMPGMGGQQLAETLAARGRISRAVLVSGYPEGMTETGPAGLLAWTFLPKPFTASDLYTALAEVLTATKSGQRA